MVEAARAKTSKNRKRNEEKEELNSTDADQMSVATKLIGSAVDSAEYFMFLKGADASISVGNWRNGR